MSVQENLSRVEAQRHEHAVVAMRPLVTRVVAKKARLRSLVEDAVSEALTQMIAAGEHVGDPDEVRERWILYAKRRMMDEQESAEYRRRDPAPLDEHALALSASVSGDLGQATERDRAEWRTREQLNELDGDDRAWAEAWFDELLAGSLPAGAQPRGLARRFGWDTSRTKTVSFEARKKMVAFSLNHASGVICEQRRELLDEFIATNESGQLTGNLDEQHYKKVLFHIAGCDACRAVWDSRRRGLRGRAIAIFTGPFGWIGGVAHALRAKLAGLIGSAHGASYSLRQRLGIGGGGAAAAGGGAAAIGKAGVICGAVVCAAGAAGGVAIEAGTSILPPALRASVHHATTHRPSHPSTRPAQTQAAHLASYIPPAVAQPSPTRPVTVTPVKAKTKTPSVTPGDLSTANAIAGPGVAQQPASQGTATATTAAVSTSTGGAATVHHHASAPAGKQGTPPCTPGDLGC